MFTHFLNLRPLPPRSSTPNVIYPQGPLYPQGSQPVALSNSVFNISILLFSPQITGYNPERAHVYVMCVCA